MRAAIVSLLLLLAVVASAHHLHVDPPSGSWGPAIAGDFTSNITISQGSQKLTGYIISDNTGQRTFQYVKELNESVYEFQNFAEEVTYQYTIMSGGCTCTRTPSSTVKNIFASLVAASPSKKACNATSGTLYVNDQLPGLDGTPTSSYCVDGATPKYWQSGSQIMTFTNFKQGRPTSFPFDFLVPWINECANSCL